MPYSTNINSDRSQSLIRLEGAQAMKLVKKMPTGHWHCLFLEASERWTSVVRLSFIVVAGTEGAVPETFLP